MAWSATETQWLERSRRREPVPMSARPSAQTTPLLHADPPTHWHSTPPQLVSHQMAPRAANATQSATARGAPARRICAPTWSPNGAQITPMEHMLHMLGAHAWSACLEHMAHMPGAHARRRGAIDRRVCDTTVRERRRRYAWEGRSTAPWKRKHKLRLRAGNRADHCGLVSAQFASTSL